MSFIQYMSIYPLKHILPAYKSARNKESISTAGLVAIFNVNIPRRPLDDTFLRSFPVSLPFPNKSRLLLFRAANMAAESAAQVRLLSNQYIS